MDGIKEKIVIVNSLSPGDILMMTCAIRSLQQAHPGRFEVDVRSPCNEIFMHSPYIQPVYPKNPDDERDIIEKLKADLDHPPLEFDNIKYLIAHYPEIHRSGMTGSHFSDGHRMFLSKQLNIPIPATGMQPDLFFSDAELALVNPVVKFGKYTGRYWVLNAGIKNDYTLKWYNHYQEVVDLLQGKIQFVQTGDLSHNHPPLKGVIDLRGKTNLRGFFRVCREADGIVSCVSMPMVVAAALKKPCVVVAGAREGLRWQINPDHQFLYRNGVMSCADYDGCWKSRKEDCVNRHAESGEPMCMELIAPQEIVRAIELYYLGGRIKPLGEVKIDDKFPMMKRHDGEGMLPCTSVSAILESKAGIKFTDLEQRRMINAHIFNVLRILKQHNPQDQYLEAYQGHYAKRGETFVDSYHVMHWIGSHFAPNRILEIGCRTGVSICQLLSSYFDYSKIQEITLCDIFAEQGSAEGVLNNLAAMNIPVAGKVQFRKGSSLEEMPKMIAEGKKYDYVLVDGCHDKDYARQDLINAVALVDDAGFVLFDDITPDGCSLQDVWDDFKENFHDQFLFMEDHNGKGIGIARKKIGNG